tara:strand:- start:5016 stop:5894 length:879 start_codon:yes stop_codon:yes gene_type:complete
MYLFTEMVGVPEIGLVMLKNYLKYHSDVIHIYCTEEDKKCMSSEIDSDLVKYVIVGAHVTEGYKKGHWGTAEIYADLLLDDNIEDDILHIDSDVIFKSESVSLLKEKLSEGFALVGGIRRYKDNPNNRKDCEYRDNVVATSFFGFKKSYITKRDRATLRGMVHGGSIDGQPVIDFFDPISFDILTNGGRIYHVPRVIVGGFAETGRDKNIEPYLGEDLDYGENMIHFAGIGSGLRKFKGEGPYMNEGYALWAVDRYKMFSNLFAIEEEYFTLSEDKQILQEKLQNTDNDLFR